MKTGDITRSQKLDNLDDGIGRGAASTASSGDPVSSVAGGLPEQ
jgi:hypothetical protein